MRTCFFLSAAEMSYRPSRSLQTIVAVGVVVTVSCTTSTTQQEMPNTQVTPLSVDSSSLRRSSSLTMLTEVLRTGRVQYHYQTSSIIQVTAGDSIPRMDSVSVVALITVDLATQASGITQAIITSDSTTLRTGSSLPQLLTTTRDTLLLRSSTGQPVRQAASAALCDVGARDVIVRSEDVVPRLPTRWESMVWSDTLDRSFCRAGIQLRAHLVTRYQLDSTVSPIRILRTTVTTFSGQGLQWNQPAEASGQSMATDTLFIDSGGRRLVGVRGVTQLDLNFRSRLRNQHFRQTTQLTIQPR